MRHPSSVETRQLTHREDEILTFLLSADFPRVEKLRDQAPTAQVSGRCECGCATIVLAVDESLPVAKEVAQKSAVDAIGRQRADSGTGPDLILFVEEGRLASIEIVFGGSEFASEFPPPDQFEKPVALWFDGAS